MELSNWQLRAPEEANLFNPAFCGALLFEFITEYEKAKRQPVPYPLPFCALTVALHPTTREELPNSTITSLYAWLENHPEALIGFADRAKNLSPLIKEALRFAMDRNVIDTNEGGDLATGTHRASFSRSIMDTVTHDARECVRATRMLGRWFPRAGTTATILSGWGLRP